MIPKIFFNSNVLWLYMNNIKNKPNIYLQISLPFRGIVQQQKQNEVFDMYHPILNHLWYIYQHRF